jgi:hypothetical protein
MRKKLLAIAIIPVFAIFRDSEDPSHYLYLITGH